MGRLSNGMRHLARRRKEIDGESVTYVRGATSLPITAVPSLTNLPTETIDGQVAVRQTHRDFLIDPANLSTLGDPLKGDRITWDGQTWEVAAIIDGSRCFSPCDGYGHMIRVHTRCEE